MKRTAWLPFGAPVGGQPKLLCLPHAGAGASVYRSWAEGLERRGVAGCPVQPPGRERRLPEAPFTDVGPLARELAREIVTTVAGPFALLGHSTGALSAFETARELRRIGGPQPLHLFVSGRGAPQIPLARHDLTALSLTELAEVLRRLGGTPEAVLSEPSLLAALQPVLAADFRVNEIYDHRPEPPLATPVTAFTGSLDTGADLPVVSAWRTQTSASFRLHVLSGGHFALFEHKDLVHEHIAEALAAEPAPPTALHRS
ncbi:alpha/beta fold hydrolase [Streptomyces hyaluromycini]|uniref:Alpha/beta fold hydrolase n=1 Tax=Streptomyces hyaluromycini TaxID=1377993 RepID=A0ABV1XD12_9ACTN